MHEIPSRNTAEIDPATTLQRYFGFGQFRPGQREVIEHLLAGHSAAAVFPTGGGKSLCYQLPALVLPGVTLVVSPLIALMKDQIDALAARGITARRLDSTLTAEEYRDVMVQIRSGTLRLLYVAPERFQNERFRESMAHARVSLFAVDEAHCISEWGHNFRPDYLKLVEFARQCKAERLLALTATATPHVLSDIMSAFDISTDCAIRNSFYRPNLTLLTTPVKGAQRDELLIERLRSRPAGPTIVYVTLQRTAEELATLLANEGFSARAYHAGMESGERSTVQEWFMSSATNIVVATIAFGMGIDKADIRYVYHYNLPKSLENYSQEIGRAGRDDKPATCEMLACLDDLNQLENFIYGDTPTLSAVHRLVKEVFGQGPEIHVSNYDLSSSCDIRALVVRTLLTYLELDGYISGGTPYFSSFRFLALLPSNQILAKFAGERREFLASLFRQVSKARKWLTIDVDHAAKNLHVPRDRIVRALDYLGDQGWIKLESSGTRHRYERKKMPEDLSVLARELHERTVVREKNEVARLRQLIDYIECDTCQVNALCQHFGESREEACGHCTRCLKSEGTEVIQTRSTAPINESIFDQAVALRREHPRPLKDPVLFTRFLCGLPSPALSKARLGSHALFGSLGEQSYSTVWERVQTLA